MNSSQPASVAKLWPRIAVPTSVNLACLILTIVLIIAACGFSAAAQTEQPPNVKDMGAVASAGAQGPSQQSTGSISGTVVDTTGGAVAGARVTLMQSARQEAVSGQDGHYSFASVAPGPFTLTVSATGFATQTFSGTLHAGETHTDPPVVLSLAANITEVQVVAPGSALAEKQIKEEEKQRVLGVVPNFYVSYIADAAPLGTKQKFELAWKTTLDPITFALTGAVAGLQQAQDQFEGYGQGAQGYGKRFGAAYADTAVGTFIGSAILPSLFKQDPRYFYKGTGSTRSRFLYALANAVICKGDNKRWQPNYSSILGNLTAGGISNLYYPPESRGVAFTFENGLIAIGEGAAANLFQEFLVRKLTPNVLNHQPAKS